MCSVERHWFRIKIDGDLPEGRYGHTMCVVDEVIYVFGGQKDGEFMGDVWVLDLSFRDSPLHRPEKLLAGSSDFSESWYSRDPIWELVPSYETPANRTNHAWIPYDGKIYMCVSSPSTYGFPIPTAKAGLEGLTANTTTMMYGLFM